MSPWLIILAASMLAQSNRLRLTSPVGSCQQLVTLSVTVGHLKCFWLNSRSPGGLMCHVYAWEILRRLHRFKSICALRVICVWVCVLGSWVSAISENRAVWSVFCLLLPWWSEAQWWFCLDGEETSVNSASQKLLIFYHILSLCHSFFQIPLQSIQCNHSPL